VKNPRELFDDAVLIARTTKSFKREVFDDAFERGKSSWVPANKISKCKKANF
jgi:hypothetical protein